MQDNVQRKTSAWGSQLLKGSLELAVLLALKSSRRYGLELVEHLNAAGLPVRDGSIYPLLSRLKAEGKVEAEWIDEGSGHPRKYYRITAGGKRTCAELLEAWRRHAQALEALAGDTDGRRDR